MSASFPLILFVFVGLFSPGPNVVMLTASGARFGFHATLPHLLGVPIGTGLLGAISGLGLGTILLAVPTLKFTCQVIAALWILWLAIRTAQAGRVAKSDDLGRPFRFHEAIMFQAINPKVWAIALAASAGFGIGLSTPLEALRLFIAFSTINLAVCLFWTSIGHMLSSTLNDPKVWRIFMTTMAALMAATVVMIFV
ncbi:LysE family translocator [bacterium]|nr:LysE family translocator [bacterium]